jgi:hypothetical protein
MSGGVAGDVGLNARRPYADPSGEDTHQPNKQTAAASHSD